MSGHASKREAAEVVRPDPQTPKLLAGQMALVTGANSGIGKGIAVALAEAGAGVLANWISDEQAAEEVAQACRDRGVRATAHQADISDEEQVRDMFDRARQELGTVDILVNNAGIQRDAPFADMTLEQWRSVLDVNLTGQFLCAREAVREFRQRGVVAETSCAAGKIIFIGSVHETIPWAGHVNYAASKGGVAMLMKSLAQEVARDRIRVNGIAPGAIKTPINREMWESPEARQRLLELIPYNRIGSVEDIGRAAVWLASDHADYVTGATLYVDGGMTLFPGFSSGG